MRSPACVLLLASVSVVPAASAQEPPRLELCAPGAVGCDGYAGEWLHREAAFDTVMLDSGWQPPGAPIQLRFQIVVAASTEVAMSGDVLASWPVGIEAGVHGRPGTGVLSIDYGLEVRAQLRFDVSVAGVRYRWEGDLPIPGVPEDLRMAARGVFDPFLLPPSERPFEVSDSTETVEVFSYDALGTVISIPGVGGGVTVGMRGDLAARYQTERIIVTNTGTMAAAPSITMENARTLVRAAASDFGPTLDLAVHPEGTLTHEATIVVVPALYLEFPGGRRDLTIAELPLQVLERSGEVVFPDLEGTIPLPDVEVTPVAVELGPTLVGDLDERAIQIRNDGEAPLRVRVTDLAAPFTSASSELTLPPRAAGMLVVRFAPTEAGAAAGVLVLETNDPDTPTVTVTLGAEGLAVATEDASVALDAGPGGAPDSDGGCGCDVPGRTRPEGHLGWGLAALAMALGARRRRRRRRGRR